MNKKIIGASLYLTHAAAFSVGYSTAPKHILPASVNPSIIAEYEALKKERETRLNTQSYGPSPLGSPRPSEKASSTK